MNDFEKSSTVYCGAEVPEEGQWYLGMETGEPVTSQQTLALPIK